jgi:hypothetical protein
MSSSAEHEVSAEHELSHEQALQIKKSIEQILSIKRKGREVFAVMEEDIGRQECDWEDYCERDAHFSDINENDHFVDGTSIAYLLFKEGDEFVPLSFIGTAVGDEDWYLRNIFKETPFDRKTQLKMVRKEYYLQYQTSAILVSVLFKDQMDDKEAKEVLEHRIKTNAHTF